jgi:hypothetical protein
MSQCQKVPIIPEYLLRIQHPNNTDLLLNDHFDEPPLGSSESAAASDEAVGRVKRQQFEWDSADWDRAQEAEEEDERQKAARRRKVFGRAS